MTGVDTQGRSCVVSDEVLPASGVSLLLHSAVPADLPAWARELGDADIAGNQPLPGSSRFNLIVLPPWEQFVQGLEQHRVPGMDDRGFHTTKTIDYCHVIDGPLMLDLDTESVELGPGDVVVQQATRHAWRNPGEVPVRFLAVLTTFPEVEPG